MVHAPCVIVDWLNMAPLPYPTLSFMHEVVAFCNNANIAVDDSGSEAVVGNPVDIALLTCFGARDTIAKRADAKVKYEQPFSSTTKTHLTVKLSGIVENAVTYTACVKGAPEVLLKMSTHYFDQEGKSRLIDEAFISAYHSTYSMFASSGGRVIGFCSCPFVAEDGAFDQVSGLDVSAVKNLPVPSTGYTFIGLVAMQDPPRERVADAIVACQQAGIKVFMITGDHPLTAKAIAQQVGILPGRPVVRPAGYQRVSSALSIVEEKVPLARTSSYDSQTIFHGERVPLLTNADWDLIFQQSGVVFARTTPEHKLLIVQQARMRNFVVAVTGDGVNDSPALKAANVGIAMGQCGTSVAREAADIILTNDDFSSIVDGIREGRVLFDNLKKTIAYTLTHLWAEILPVLLTISLSFPPGLSSLLILSVDLGTELVPAISLAYEGPEADVMAHKARNIETDRLVSKQLMGYAYLQAGCLEALVCVLAWLNVFTSHNVPLSALPFSFEENWKQGAPPIVGTDGRLIFDEEQIDLLHLSQSVWFVTLVSSQVWHIWFCKTRRISLLSHSILGNVVTNLGVLIELAVVCLIVYVPSLNDVFSTRPVPGKYWLWSFMSLGLLGVVTEARKWIIRTFPSTATARLLAW